MSVGKAYQALIARLLAEQPPVGYFEAYQLPPLSINDLVTVLRHESSVLAAVRLDPETIAQAFEVPELNRQTLRLAMNMRSSVEAAVRDYLFCEVVDRLRKPAAADSRASASA